MSFKIETKIVYVSKVDPAEVYTFTFDFKVFVLYICRHQLLGTILNRAQLWEQSWSVVRLGEDDIGADKQTATN